MRKAETKAMFERQLAIIQAGHGPEACPDVDTHTRERLGYLDWHAWAAKMAKTHTQHRCPTCGFWVIWKRNPEHSRKVEP